MLEPTRSPSGSRCTLSSPPRSKWRRHPATCRRGACSMAHSSTSDAVSRTGGTPDRTRSCDHPVAVVEKPWPSPTSEGRGESQIENTHNLLNPSLTGRVHRVGFSRRGSTPSTLVLLPCWHRRDDLVKVENLPHSAPLPPFRSGQRSRHPAPVTHCHACSTAAGNYSTTNAAPRQGAWHTR